MKTHLGTNLTLTQRLSLMFFGFTKTKKRSRPGWNGELFFYAFKCFKHGVVEDYPHGFDQRLECPLCVKYKTQQFNQEPKIAIQTVKTQ